MDGRRFDLFSRWLVTGSSRRLTLRALAAGVVTAGLGRFGLEEAAAKCVKPGKKCKKKHGKNKKCCGGVKCKGKRCQCLGGAPRCGKHKTCCQPGQVCQGDFCRTCNAEECCSDADCPPDGQCGFPSTCHYPPNCTGSTGQHCDLGSECCSGSCLTPDDVCAASSSGQPCHVDTDCASGSCVLFVCA